MKTIIGAGGGGKGGGGSARVAVEAKDSLRSKAFARVMDLVSEGEIGGLVDGLKSVYLDGTPIQNDDGSNNFTGVELATRVGSQGQDYIPGFPTVETSTSVATEVTALTAVTRQITDPDVNAVRVTIGIPQLTKQNTSNGDINGTTVEYAIDLQSNGGGFVPQLIGSEATTANVTTVGQSWFRSTVTTAYGMVITTQQSDLPETAFMQYRLVGSSTWLTAGVTKTAGTLRLLRQDVPVSFAFSTPTLLPGQWEARMLDSTTGQPPVATVLTDDGWFNTYVDFSGFTLQGSTTEKLTGKTTSRYQRSYRIELTGSGPWDIRVRRITADSTTVALQNKTFFDLYTQIIDAKLAYPNSALVGLKIDSSQFQSIPTRGYDMKLLLVKVPSNYNPITRAYTGTWDGTFQVAWTDNPAWCFYDLVTNERYGLGGFIDEAQVDKWAMYQIGRYCDELVDDGFGGTEPRFTCNFYLQTRAEAYKVLQDFASIFRGMAFWSTGSITAVQDAPSDPVALFTAANVIEGRFNYSGSALRARHTVALVTWNDPDNQYQQAVEYVEDSEAIARYGVNQTQVVAVGCTSRGQANRVGRWLLFSERFETETIQFQVGLDGATVRPGNVIKVADSTRAGGRFGGRISASTTTTITVDKAPSESVVGWTVYAMLPSGDMESRTVSATAGVLLTVGTAFTAAPTTQGIWVLSSPAVEAQTFRVVAVSEDADTKNYSVVALKHDELKYQAIDEGLVLQPRDFTRLDEIPVPPTGLALSESLYTYQAEVRSKINVGWVGVDGIYTYLVDWRKDDGNWNRIQTQNTDIEILDTTPGVYSVKVFSSNPANLSSASAAEATITALGKTAPPSNVTGFGSVIDPSLGVTLTWTSVPDLDIDVYELRSGSSWDSGIFLADVRGSTLKLGTISSGASSFMIKALDTSGTYSAAAASTVVTMTPAAAPTVSSQIVGENVVLTWNAVQGTLFTAAYDVRYGASYATGVSLGTIKGTSFSVKADWLGARTFWIAALDVQGTAGSAGSAPVTIAASAAPTVQASFVGENLVLTWDAIQGSLGTTSYEIRYGATYAGGTSLGTIKGTTFSTKAQWVNSRSYWVAAIDLLGNVGAAGLVTATITQPAAVTIIQEVVDNNVLLRWTDATATLPIDYYELRRGPTWAGATAIGRVSARFSAIFESTGGTLSYWIVGYDLAGNAGTPANVSAVVSQPPDYTLQFNQDSAFGGTKTNFVPDSAGYLTAVSGTETWQDHFTSRGWTTPQDQINAGFPIYAMPSQTSGSYEEIIDYGAVLAATKISATLTYTAAAGLTTITPTISVRKLVTDPWIDYVGSVSVFVTDFRYAKVRFDFASAGGDDLLQVTGLNVRFDVKLKNDAGLVAAVSTDSGGTSVLFNVPFVDVQSITVTPKGTAAAIAVYDFVDVPNPTGFKILLFNTAGTRISGDVSWSVKGV